MYQYSLFNQSVDSFSLNDVIRCFLNNKFFVASRIIFGRYLVIISFNLTNDEYLLYIQITFPKLLLYQIALHCHSLTSI